MKVFLVCLLFIALANTGCSSTKAAFIAVENQAVDLPENSVKASDENIELSLTAKDAICKRSQSCKVLLDIRNLSDEDVEVYNLNFLLSAFAKEKFVEPTLTSSVDLETLANLGPNKGGTRLTIKSKDHFEKEIDLERIKWQKMSSSSWKQYDLWKFIVSGEYRVQAKVDSSWTKFSEPQSEKIGEIEVRAVRVISGADSSDFLALEFRKN